MPSIRCPCRTQKGTKCMHKINTHMNMCWIHYKQHYTKYAKTIQYIWESYKCKKISKIFMKLPSDIKNKIVWYISEPFLNVKYHYGSIVKIIKARTNSSIIIKWYETTPSNIIWSNHILDIKNLYKLYKKYLRIIPEEDIKEFMREIYAFYKIVRPLLYEASIQQSIIFIINILADFQELFIER